MSRLAMQILQFATTIFLARELSPTQFGLAAIVTAVTAFANLFSDLGLGAALIHDASGNERVRSSAFWLNALTGLVLTGLFLVLATPISHFYRQPDLVKLIAVGSFSFTLSMSVVQLSILERELRFRLIGIIEFLSAVAATVVSVTCAIGGLGAMSLVLGGIAQVTLTTVAMWVCVEWHPKHFLDRVSLRQIWSFSGHLVGFNVVNYWARNLDDILIGKFASAADLGFYSRAYALMMLPVQQITMVVGRVLFPAFARLSHDLVRLKEAYLRALGLMISVAAPLSLGLAAVAPQLIQVLYGSKWHSVAPLLAILAASGPAQVLSGTVGALYQALGLTRTHFYRGMANAAVTVVAIIIGLQWGAKGVAIALLIKFYLLVPQTVAGCWDRFGLALRDGIQRVTAPLISSAIMALCVVGLHLLFPEAAAVGMLAAQLALAAVVYGLGLRLLDKNLFRELVAVPKLFLGGRAAI